MACQQPLGFYNFCCVGFTDNFVIVESHLELSKTFDNGKQQQIFCKVPNKRLTNHAISTVTALSSRSCVTMCVKDARCYSANYHEISRTCELNDDTDLYHEDDLIIAANYLYFSTRECQTQ